MKIRGYGPIAAAGVSLLAFATVGQTAASAQEVVVEGETIVVTASRREQSLQDTPLAVTAIDPEELSRTGLNRLREVVEVSPGVHYSGGGLPNGNTITMRGVAQTGRATTVGVYVDDVPIGSSNSFAAGPSLHYDAVQGDVERIELVRGPQGTLYGSSSMGGVVRYISRDPSTSDFEGNLRADLSETEEGDTNATYSARVGIPIVSDRLGLSIAGYQEDFGGFIDRIPASPTGAAENVDAYERTGLSARLVARPTDRLDLSLMAMRGDLESTGANTVALVGPPFVQANGPFNTDEGAMQLTDEFELYAGTVSYDFGWARLLSSTSDQTRDVANASDLVATFGSLIDLLSGQPAGTTTQALFTGRTLTDRFVQEIRLESPVNEQFEWVVGAIYSREESSNIQSLLGQPGNFLALDVDLGSELVETAVFGQATFYLTPNFDIAVGARLAEIESSVALTDGPGLIVANLPETTDSDTVDTYSLTARFRPTDDLSLYARIASGYRPQNANLPLMSGGVNVAPLIIATDTLWSYEAGAKGSLMGGVLRYDLAVWYNQWSDPQAVTFVNAATTGGNANSDITAYGFEGAVELTPTRGLSIIGSLSYAHSTLDSDETAAFGALEGENLAMLPEWSAALRAQYDFPITANIDGFVGGGVRYVGERDTGYDGGVGSGGVVIVPKIANFTLDEYVVANLAAGVRAGPVEARVYVNNLFDEYGYTGGTARPIVGGVRATANVLQPRTIGVGLSYAF